MQLFSADINLIFCCINKQTQGALSQLTMAFDASKSSDAGLVAATGLTVCSILAVGCALHKSNGWRFFKVVTYFSIGQVYGMLGRRWHFGESLYFSVVTVTTVGYGDQVPVTDAGKIFVIFYIIIGVALVTDALASFAEALLASQDRVFKSMLVDVTASVREASSDGASTKENRKDMVTQKIHSDLTERQLHGVVAAVSEIALLLIVGSVFYAMNEGWSFVDAAYWYLKSWQRFTRFLRYSALPYV